MILPLKKVLILPLLLLATPLRAQSVSSGLEAYPACGQVCISKAFLGGLCLPQDQSCICSDQTFQSNVTSCVAGTCSVIESLATQNASLTACGSPTRDRSQRLITVTITMISISGLFIIMRFISKVFFTYFDLGLDDWCILATMISTIPSACITVYGTTPNGLGKDIWTLHPDEITKVIFYFYMMAWLYTIQATLIKLSYICFFLRIFISESVHRLLWGTFTFTSVWGVTFFFIIVFQCRPISYFWNSWDGMHHGTCVNANAVNWVFAGMSIALDLWILAIPLWQLRKLQLHWKKKIGVAIMLCVGTFVTVVTILRLQSLVSFAKASNSSWELFDISLWSTIEICVGIMCANLPSVRMILIKCFPKLGGSSQRSKATAGNRYGGEIPSKLTGNRSQSVNVASLDSPTTNDGAEASSGMGRQKSYTAHCSDDETHLVPMIDLITPKSWQVPHRDI